MTRKKRASVLPLRHESHTCPEPVTPGQGWEVRHRLHHKDDEGQALYIPDRAGSELLAKAGGPLLTTVALILTLLLSILFATRFAHVGLGRFNVFVTLQFLLWTIFRQGMSILALAVFELIYSATRDGRRKTISLYALDAWMSLIITPINIFRGKFLHVLLILLPSLFSIFANYATTGLLLRERSFELHDRGTKMIQVRAAGGGSPHRYVMTGQEFLYNASQGCLANPNNRFVYLLEDNKVLIPAIPDIGTYASGSTVRAARFYNVPSVVATMSATIESDRSVSPSIVPSNTTVPSLGDVYVKPEEIDKSSSILHVKILLEATGVHKQIYVDIHYKTAVSDLLFATFNNGSHINQVFDVRNVSEVIPARLNGRRNLSMESVVDNFILSQNGGTLLDVKQHNDTRVKHLGLLLASAFGIRSAVAQNWLDDVGQREATVFEEREVVRVAGRYWAVAASMSGVLVIACILLFVRRPTINGNLVQIVALLNPFIQSNVGACTPNWQKAYVEDKSFEDRIMNQRVMLGYAADPDGRREIFEKADARGVQKQRYRIAFDAPENVTRDKLSNLYGLLAG